MTDEYEEPSSGQRKRYYLMCEDLKRNPSDYKLLNEADVYPQSEPESDVARRNEMDIPNYVTNRIDVFCGCAEESS